MANFRNDELYSWESDGAYTIKIFYREDCRYYSVAVYEDEEDARVVFTSKPEPTATKAKEDAKKYLKSILI